MMIGKDSGDSIRILIGSAGRRVYLIKWFKDALDSLNVDGDVIVTENDPTSASFAMADNAYEMPRYGDLGYRSAMIDLVERIRPTIFFSVNDYELGVLANGLADKLRNLGTTVLSLNSREQRVVEDKFLFSERLRDCGIPTPATVLGSDSNGIQYIAAGAEELVVKHRYGSGSSGLFMVEAGLVEQAVRFAAQEAPGPHRLMPSDRVVVQKRAEGEEYGVDIVAPLDGTPDRGIHVFARRKLRMRGGETDKAVTVSAEPFLEVASSLSNLLRPQGLIDVDLIMTRDGRVEVIDINPRFGGGYVFSHLAGVDVPHYYLSQVLGVEPRVDWASYRKGVVSAKYEESIMTSQN